MLRRKHRKKHNFFNTRIRKLENDKTITYKIRFINSLKFTPSSLSTVADNLTEGLHNNKYKDFKSYLDVKNHGFLSFGEKIIKHLSSKYSKKFLGSAKTSTTYALKTISKKFISTNCWWA